MKSLLFYNHAVIFVRKFLFRTVSEKEILWPTGFILIFLQVLCPCFFDFLWVRTRRTYSQHYISIERFDNEWMDERGKKTLRDRERTREIEKDVCKSTRVVTHAHFRHQQTATQAHMCTRVCMLVMFAGCCLNGIFIDFFEYFERFCKW